MDINSTLSSKSKNNSPANLKSVLIIDDEPIVRESMAVYLEDCGYNVIEAIDGKQGLALFCEFQPDVVLCDLRMPEMDGMTLLNKLSKLSPDTPIIIISGAGQIHDVVEALRLGALDYLVKPISDLAVLENAVQNAIHRSFLETENKTYKNELEVANKELASNLDLLQKDQDAGRQAQLQLLPPADATISGFHFQHIIVPSLNLSGDFIDYFEIDDRYIGFYFADVSGHGSAAAFVTMMLKSLMNQPLRQYRGGVNETIIHPDELMSYLNEELISANLGKHITLFYAVIDCDTQRLNYSVAGQYPAPVLICRDTSTLLKDDGFPLGLFDWATFQCNDVAIKKGFKLLMVSDGWLELIPTKSEPAGESFLIDFVKNNPINIPMLMKPVRQLQDSNPPDDITVFIVEKEES
ncbi:MAG: sigma-B regulation protein RsbU (phosphoserine phosphatase) [Polaribacter sp.]|jgi:sigma-B regulation protein RsbU (phosphoserine phosphatase)